MKKKRVLFTILWVVLALLILCGVLLIVLSEHVKAATRAQILSEADALSCGKFDCVLIFGCRVYADGRISAMLRDRLDTGLQLYRAGAAPKILVSGDHKAADYDEVNAMKAYLVERGVPSEDVFMDHAGFSTYESVYRARAVFEAEKVLLVTQEYHLYRALYAANALGLDARGVSADLQSYRGQTAREVREILARAKDFVKCLVKPDPTYLGEAIPVSGSGDLTND